ncbi:MAG: hypothetical protein HUU09_11135 [Candidatus Jettenia caeni]|nr:hypothetical protein [Candidatus Jettenia caeni]UJS17786.1 MAG: hypothetical protein L3J17_01695 [Candidatus Jettenia sp.]
MKYLDGQEVKVGDKVQLWSGCYGVVVCSMDDDKYTPAYPKEEWDYLKSGVLIKTDKAGLIHYIKADEDLQLLERAKD